MELPTLEKLQKLVADGAVVVGPKPERSLTLVNHDADNRKLKSLADELWGDVDGKTVYENQYGKGKIIWGKPLQEILSGEGIGPDIEHRYADQKNFLYHHKKLGDQDIYYLVNQSEEEVMTEFLFKVAGKRPSLWDPLDGSIQLCHVFTQEGSRTRIPVKFRPRQSCFVVFQKADPGEHIVEIRESGIPLFPASGQNTGSENLPDIRTGDEGQRVLYAEKGGEYTLVSSKGTQCRVNVPEPEVLTPESFTGTIEFHQQDNGIKSIPINSLSPFTESEDPFVRYYSGTATYRVQFDVPEDWLEPGHHYTFLPGETGATADLQLNGSSLGIVWDPGAEIEVDHLLKPGTNSLVVTSTSTWRNRLIGEIRGDHTNGKSWTTSPLHQYLNEKSALCPAGFTGPVELLKYKPEMITFAADE
jgi:hypothetical protein